MFSTGSRLASSSLGRFVTFGIGVCSASTLVLVSAISVPRTAWSAANISFTRIVETGDPIPDGSGGFTAFDRHIAIDGSHIVFIGLGSGQEGIYVCTLAGSCERVVDATDVVPGGAGFFADFSARAHPSISGRNVSLTATDSVSQLEGVYFRDLDASFVPSVVGRCEHDGTWR